MNLVRFALVHVMTITIPPFNVMVQIVLHGGFYIDDSFHTTFYGGEKMEKIEIKITKYDIFMVVFAAVIIGIAVGSISYSMTHNDKHVEENEQTIKQGNNTNSELELRLQSEIESNQEMAQVIEDIIVACNEKLADKHNNTVEKLKKENEILQKALSKLREL